MNQKIWCVMEFVLVENINESIEAELDFRLFVEIFDLIYFFLYM